MRVELEQAQKVRGRRSKRLQQIAELQMDKSAHKGIRCPKNLTCLLLSVSVRRYSRPSTQSLAPCLLRRSYACLSALAHAKADEGAAKYAVAG